ncbi:MAG: cache domain-containing protein, partial [Desulfovibrionaceae bacterium]|nr:cache domain-containing protein [Desulfovibrionaceae bacterium]
MADEGSGKPISAARKRGLTTRLVSGYLFLSVITVTMVAVLSYVAAKSALKHEVVSRLELAAGLKKAQFERWLDEQELDLVFLAGSPEIRGLSARLNLPESDPGRWEAVGGLCEYLIEAVRHHPNFNELFLIEPLGGRVAVSSTPARAGRFVPGHSYFKKGLEGTFVQPVHPSPETLEPVLTMSTPVPGPKGDPAGVLAAQLDLKRVGNGKASGLGESGEMYFVDAYHVFVSGE